MSFAVYPQADACRALMPTPDPAPPGPPSRPMVCHMPKGHDGSHALVRRPGVIDRRWEGDARPPTPPPVAVPDSRFRDQLAEALPESLGPVGLRRRAIPALGVEASVTGYGLVLLDALMPTIAAHVEARVQAAANQRAVETERLASLTRLIASDLRLHREEWPMVRQFAARLDAIAALAQPAPERERT